MKLEIIIEVFGEIIFENEGKSEIQVYDAIQDQVEDWYLDDYTSCDQNDVLVNLIDGSSSLDDLMYTLNSKTFEREYTEAGQ